MDTGNSHGTGCTLASAVAAGLAKGLATSEAVRQVRKKETRTGNVGDSVWQKSGVGVAPRLVIVLALLLGLLQGRRGQPAVRQRCYESQQEKIPACNKGPAHVLQQGTDIS